ncbi:MAG: choice-of-anchor tandem repeat GloVer-containing protein [Nostoc sp.]|uniref:choice-of-anchor tandem repeat GloVer-containing protein n=1 Tax=Nostoc sp. TaxID=1180 RepID=UPI002FF994E2
MNKTNLYKQRQNKKRVSILTSLAVLASPLVLPLHQAVAASLTTVANFNGANGSAPRAGVFQGKDLNLYGTTSAGGSSNNGSAFKLSGAGFNTLTTLINFTGTALPNRGINPIARLFQASNGNLYGATFTGGASNLGTLFSLASPAFTGLTTLVNFTGISNGANPAGRLIADSTGKVLWGTASAGGASNKGTIFNVPLSGSPVTTVISFTGTNGATPLARLQLVTTNGSYYGTASLGGASNKGVVFKYTPANPIATRYSFSSFTGANGASPEAGLTVSSGFIYGTTRLGGASNVGAIFKVPIGTATNPIGAPVLVASFSGVNGANPKAALTPGASSGIFYGTASTGGANNKGVVYRLNVGTTSTITQLISFNTTNGATPESTLIPVGTDYYGTASAGGTYGKGTVFKFTP